MESFGELSLREVVMFALGEVGLSKQTEIQLVDVTSGVLGSHTGSRMTFFYLLLVCCSGMKPETILVYMQKILLRLWRRLM